MRRVFQSRWFGALFCGSIGFTIVLSSLAVLGRGQLHYANYWGGQVFAPFAAVLGAAFAIIGSWKWKAITAPAAKLKGKARRAAERTAKMKFPIETYRKW